MVQVPDSYGAEDSANNNRKMESNSPAVIKINSNIGEKEMTIKEAGSRELSMSSGFSVGNGSDRNGEKEAQEPDIIIDGLNSNSNSNDFVGDNKGSVEERSREAENNGSPVTSLLPPPKEKEVVELIISDDDDNTEQQQQGEERVEGLECEERMLVDSDREDDDEDNISLDMEVEDEPLSRAQMMKEKATEMEIKELDNKLSDIRKKSLSYNVLPRGCSVYGVNISTSRPAPVITSSRKSSTEEEERLRITTTIAPRLNIIQQPSPPIVSQPRYQAQATVSTPQQQIPMPHHNIPPPQRFRISQPPHQQHQQQQQTQQYQPRSVIVHNPGPPPFQQQQQQQQQQHNPHLHQLGYNQDSGFYLMSQQQPTNPVNTFSNIPSGQIIRYQQNSHLQGIYQQQQPPRQNLMSIVNQNMQQQPNMHSNIAQSFLASTVAAMGSSALPYNVQPSRQQMQQQQQPQLTRIINPHPPAIRMNAPNIMHRVHQPNIPIRTQSIPLQPQAPNISQNTGTRQNTPGMSGSAKISLSSSLMMTSEQETAQDINADNINGPASAEGSTQKQDNGKTFPSLVVVARACLLDKPGKEALAKARNDLDQRMKALLILEPSKLTEYLMQRGLLRLEHKCVLHKSADTGLPVMYRLGMYSDGGKQPFSGGYVWISECCPDNQVSVFTGSIFEASPYQPGSLLKLIYHWACQTSANNILAWVKVTNYYLKNFYTLLRSVCVGGLQEFCPIMGGTGKFVEIGIITLGTTVQGQKINKQVKVEILGVFDPASKVIRMKVINPNNNLSIQNASHQRVIQILHPLNDWVNRDSTILIDASIDKALLRDMGFKSVVQVTSNEKQSASIPSNINVMNYLKHVVPKMFQNTLCVLSKSLVQQFLDELAWREIWGLTSNDCFENILKHMIAMTKWETNETLISRLNKISTDPFEDWTYMRRKPQVSSKVSIEDLPDCLKGDSLMDLIHPQLNPTYNPKTIAPRPSTPVGNQHVVNNGPTTSTTTTGGFNKRKQDLFASSCYPKSTQSPPPFDITNYLRTEDKTNTLEVYYYASAERKQAIGKSNVFPPHLKCPLCSKLFTTNLEIMKHIFMHVNSLSRTSQNFCEYCLKEIGPSQTLASHIHDYHRMTNVTFGCRICQEKFTTENNLILHMWETHQKWEMPYACEICQFRSSFHNVIVDHYNKAHTGSDSVLCTLCLKVWPARSFNCIKQIVVHVQGHTIRKGKKCPQCVLNFTQDSEYRVHLAEGAHQSGTTFSSGITLIPHTLGKGAKGIRMASPPKMDPYKVMPPPAKRAKTERDNGKRPIPPPVEALGNYQIIEHHPLRKMKEQNSCCLECDQKISNPNHFPGFMNCLKCRFSTSCKSSMELHQYEVHSGGRDDQKPGLKIIPQELLPVSMICTCGFRTKNGHAMASHLSDCRKSTAFSVQSGEKSIGVSD